MSSKGLYSVLNAQCGTIHALWNTFAGGSNTPATENSTGIGTYYLGGPPDVLFDNNFGTKYSSRGSSSSWVNDYVGLNTGFYMTVAQCQPVFIGFRFGNVYDKSDREPVRITIEGTNCADVGSCLNWTLLYHNGSSDLDIQENISGYGEYQSVSTSDIYQSYRFLATAKRNTGPFVSYSEVQLFGYSNQNGTSNRNSTVAANSISGVGTYYDGQSPDYLFDNKTNTKYTSRGNASAGVNAITGLNTGSHATVGQYQPTLMKFHFTTASSGFN